MTNTAKTAEDVASRKGAWYLVENVTRSICMIIRKPTDLDEIWKEHNHYYDDRVKFCLNLW